MPVHTRSQSHLSKPCARRRCSSETFIYRVRGRGDIYLPRVPPGIETSGHRRMQMYGDDPVTLGHQARRYHVRVSTTALLLIQRSPI